MTAKNKMILQLGQERKHVVKRFKDLRVRIYHMKDHREALKNLF